MSNLHMIAVRLIGSYFTSVIVICLFLLIPVYSFASSITSFHDNNDVVSIADIDQIDRQISITNGVRTSVGQYPFLTAVLSGRQVTLSFEDGPSSARYFSGGVISEFTGDLVDCGFANSVCIDVVDKICSIILDFPVADHLPLTPAMQLQNCRRGGAIAAVFRPNSRNYIERLDLFDGNPKIPAVYLHDEEGYQHLLLALAEGKLRISAVNAVPDNALCGGTYLGGQWVLTAAHCVVRKLDDGSYRVVNASELLVNVGVFNLEEEKVFTQGVDEILINDYRLAGGWDENDYALLRIDSEPQRGSAISLADTESLDAGIAAAQPALVVGWGSTAVREPLTTATLTNATTSTPLAATLQMQSTQSCRTLWRDFLLLSGTPRPVPDIREIHLCASSEIQQDTCQGDSGGPLMIDVDGELQLAGITSFGLGCGGSLGLPGVYARVPAFREWVLAKTGPTVAQQNVRVLSGDVFTSQASGGGALTASPAALAFIFLLLLRSSRRVRRTLLMIPVVALAACGADQPRKEFAVISADASDTNEQMDVVYNNGVLSAVVVSTGCTLAEHFEVQHSVLESGNCDITVSRTQADLCKRAAQAQSISIDWKIPASCDNIIVANPPLTRD